MRFYGSSFLLLLFIALAVCGCATGAEAERAPMQYGDASNLPVAELPPLSQMRRGELLEGVHPQLVSRIRLMYALLEQEGIPIRMVSGHRPHAGFDKPNRLASWHNLGMAVDLTLADRDSLANARAHYEDDADKWARIGEIAQGLGIIWGERYDDIFHFEWHPGYHSRIRDDEYAQFQQLAGPELAAHDAVWHLFEPAEGDGEQVECFGGCYEIPDRGLRRLLAILTANP